MENLVELSKQELLELDGGVFGLDDLLIGLAIAAGAQIMGDWDNFVAGLSGEPEIK